MSSSARSFSYLAVAVLSLALGVAIAAPILPGRAMPEPDVMSVANITRVRLFVHPINDARMESLGFTTEAVEKQMRDRLRTTGIEVVDDGDAPLLSLRTLWIHEPKVNEARGYLLVLRLEQPAELPRLDRTLQVPTLTIPVLGLEHESDVLQAAQRNVNASIDTFVQMVHIATAAAAR